MEFIDATRKTRGCFMESGIDGVNTYLKELNVFIQTQLKSEING